MRRLTGVLCGVLLLVAGCGSAGFSGLYNTPLPGGADLGDHPFRITAEFADVLDLVPQAAVKVNDVAIGRVDTIELAPDTRSAIVRMSVNGDLKMPENSFAQLRQSSLLGEKFVQLAEPAGEAAAGALHEGSVIPLARTNRNPEVEEVLGALSLLLNGGGVNQLADITRELNHALTGNEAEIRALLSRVDRLATELDGQKTEIVRAIDGLNRLSGTLVAQTANLTNALDNLAPGMAVVTQQRDQLVGMLQSLDHLSGVAVDTINASRDSLVADLRALQPTLSKLAEAGTNLPEALKILPTYPLPDVAGDVIRGDYANVTARIDLNLDSIFQNIANSGHFPTIDLPGGNPGAAQTADVPLPLTPQQTAPTGTQQQPTGLLPGVTGLLGSLLGGTP
ncbi:MCE family protein [Amycolatopsis thermophila]|uniref:Phospholipid/cholesterol/gamma-HCH transport system substrate-binding protein n=1 Tax=Amycolatopsis thermophila TaxID=206084 RepID=A0ABU0EXQ5_9PSEU|nr:MCE family protein [Amycolatopsis thermophila]MDQ0380051.1 phospholipid/cholesterol/gamma-HCH transport system substrate-binding protein [Amycolatopsis thermophila]